MGSGTLSGAPGSDTQVAPASAVGAEARAADAVADEPAATSAAEAGAPREMDFFAPGAPAPLGQAPSADDTVHEIKAEALDPNNLLAAFGAAPPRAARPAAEAFVEHESAVGVDDEQDDVAFI